MTETGRPGRVFESTHPLVRHKLSVLRQADTGVRRFRELAWELTTLLAYEALADLAVVAKTIVTPLAETTGYALKLSLIHISEPTRPY